VSDDVAVADCGKALGQAGGPGITGKWFFRIPSRPEAGQSGYADAR